MERSMFDSALVGTRTTGKRSKTIATYTHVAAIGGP